MSVTNTIRSKIEYSNNEWNEIPLNNDEIIEALEKEKKNPFLSFSYGVWVTAYARNNLLRNMILLDEYIIYSDTDSLKLKEGYNKEIIENYNRFVQNKIKFVSKKLDIPIEKFAPKDIKGESRMLGVFDCDGTYDEFITQGAKKYCYKQNGEIHITVAGVPKTGSKVLKEVGDFKDDLVFPHDVTGKNMLFYVDEQPEFIVTDYQGRKYKNTDKTGICIFPCSYTLGKSLEYVELLTENSSERSKFKEYDR